MMGRGGSLVGRLTLVHALVVALACVVLVSGSLAGGAWLLRSDQDGSLGALAASLCRNLEHERAEHPQYHDLIGPLREAFEEAALPGMRYEAIGQGGERLASEGDLPGWTEGAAGIPRDGACLSVDRGGTWRRPVLFRACAHTCEGKGITILAAGLDALGHPHWRLAAIGIVAMLPLAVVAGALVGSALFRGLLAPLGLLRDAADRLERAPGAALGVRARASELAALERSFDRLIASLGAALQRERRFAQEASHELRTPLTMLRGRLERLVGLSGADPDQRAELRAAVEEVGRLDRLVEALLLLARSEAEPLPATPVNLCDLAREVARRQEEADGEGGTPLEIDAPDEILVGGSEELLERALGNLVENSRKFAGARARIRVRVAVAGGRGVVTVEDDGPGIPPEVRANAFERFVRGPAVRGRVDGVGLGLAVVRAIVARHGGEVTAEPGSAGGERLRISLPLLGAPAGAWDGDPAGRTGAGTRPIVVESPPLVHDGPAGPRRGT